jgi:hypothetical protein
LANSVTASPSQEPVLFINQIKNVSVFIPSRIKETLDEFQYKVNYYNYYNDINMNNDYDDGYLIISLPYDCDNNESFEKGKDEKRKEEGKEKRKEEGKEKRKEEEGKKGNITFIELTPNNLKTPSDNKQHIGETTNMARIQAFFNQILGEMVAYEAEGEGCLFQDMVPSRSLSQTQTSLGSTVELEIHTEQAFSKRRPDFLSLACLRSDSEAQTFVLHKHEIMKNLTKEKRQLLYEPLWMVGVDMSFKISSNEKVRFIESEIRGPIPIIHKDDTTDEFIEKGYYHCNSINDSLVFDQDLMFGITEESENLKKEIIEIYYKHRKSYVLQQGDIVILDNRRVVHGRSSFHPKFDGNDRFIVRSFVLTSTNFHKHAFTRKNNRRMIEAFYS